VSVDIEASETVGGGEVDDVDALVGVEKEREKCSSYSSMNRAICLLGDIARCS
jgi:hypothetical protein